MQNVLIICQGLCYVEMDFDKDKENANTLGPFAKGRHGSCGDSRVHTEVKKMEANHTDFSVLCPPLVTELTEVL